MEIFYVIKLALRKTTHHKPNDHQGNILEFAMTLQGHNDNLSSSCFRWTSQEAASNPYFGHPVDFCVKGQKRIPPIGEREKVTYID